ncbi:MAG: DUF302 domain-containing protein [Bacteroidota bacterium]
MSYYFSKILVGCSFEEAVQKVTAELKKEGFGVLTEIDVKETFKNKLDLDFKKYKILGACSPQSAYDALQLEDKVGVFLPCNIVVEEHESGGIEVSSIDPVALMISVNNEALVCISTDVRKKLQKVINGVN